MAQLKIKPEYGKNIIGFAGNAKPLKDRSHDELVKLAIIGLESNDQSILSLFEGSLPPLADLKAGKVREELKVIPKPVKPVDDKK